MHQRSVQSWIKHIDFIILDLIALEVSFIVAYFIRFGIINPFDDSAWRRYALIIFLIDGIILVMGKNLSGILRRGYLRELMSVSWHTLILVGIIALCLYALYEGSTYSRLVVGFNAVLYIIFSWALRCLWKNYLHRQMSQHVRKFVIFGSGELSDRLENALVSDRTKGVILEKIDQMDADALVILEKVLSGENLFEVVTALPAGSEETVKTVVLLCEKYGVRVNVIPSYSDVMSSQASIEEIGDVKLLNFRTTPLDNMTNAMIKRLFDIISGALLIIITSPVMLFAAAGTKLSGVGSIIFRQERVGRNKKTFKMLKFRSMRDIGTENTGWTTDDDPRKTKFGAFLRKYSIDEFPQFFNVVAGHMSLIGPRPELPHHVEHFVNEIPMYQVRHQVRPGITGWAQVNGLRGDTSIEERVKYDVWYIENWSIALDIKIIFKTVFGGMVNSEKL